MMSESNEKPPKAKNTILVFLLNFKGGLGLICLGLMLHYQHKLQAPYNQISLALLPPIILNPEPHRIRKKYCIKTDKGLKYYK